MKGRLSKKGADVLGAPHLSGKTVDYTGANAFGTTRVTYKGDYLGAIDIRRITPIKRKKKKSRGFFKKIFG